MQSSYEIIKAAIRFEKPERLPVQFGSLGINDNAFIWRPMNKNEGAGAQLGMFELVAPKADAWGCVWDQTEMKNMGQVVGHPFSDGIPDDLEKTSHPNYDDDRYYEGVEEDLAAAEADGKYIQAGLFMVLFERVHSMMGFENAMVGLADSDIQPDVRRLMEFITRIHLAYIDNLDRRFPGRIHAICMTDDFGTQSAAYVSGQFWIDFFLPYYKRLFDRMHEAGYDVWVHSCGKVNEIIEGYIQAGAQVVNLQQPRALGIEEVGRQYSGRITFESLCDIQSTLPTGDSARVAADAEKLMTCWASPEGGFIFSDYGDGEAIGVPKAMKAIMYNEFSRWSEKVYGQPLPEIAGDCR